jgi:hypothetical protein
VFDALDMLLYFIAPPPGWLWQRINAPIQTRTNSKYVTATSTSIYNQYGIPARLGFVYPNITQKFINLGAVKLGNYFTPEDLLICGQQTGFAILSTIDQYSESGSNIPNISFTYANLVHG